MKAKLVTFVITARVVVPDDDIELQVADTALSKIQRNTSEYLKLTNYLSMCDDVEHPYSKDDKWEAASRYSYMDSWSSWTPEYQELKAMGRKGIEELNERLSPNLVRVEYNVDKDCYDVIKTNQH